MTDEAPDQPLDVSAVDVDERLLTSLLRSQLPHLAAQPIRILGPWGTDNAMFRVGDDLLARLPRRGWAKTNVAKEARWLPELASARPALPVAVPEVVHVGAPSPPDYPWVWAVLRWLPGTSPDASAFAVDERVAGDVGEFLSALWRLELDGVPAPGVHNGYRGGPCRRRDRWVRPAIERVADDERREVLGAIWDDALRRSPWAGRPTLVHGDLTPMNTLLVDGRLAAVIDWGQLALGDPACDLMIAWNFDGPARAALRHRIDVDDATWDRGRAAAFWQWVGGLDEDDPTNEARRVIDRIVEDFTTSGDVPARS